MSSDRAITGGSTGRLPKLPLHWLGILPFAAFIVLFLVMPTMKIVIGAFQTPDGDFTLSNIRGLFTPSIMAAAALAFVSCVGNFGIPAFLGIPANYLVLPTLIYQRLAGDRELTVMRAAGLSPWSL
eukprot:gene53726-73466_t